jgi:thiosulfate dehydrogenase [quinone] large subunit
MNRSIGQSMFAANLLLPLRAFMAITFLYAGAQHLTDPAYFDSSKPGYIGHLIAQYAVGSPLHDFLLGTVEPSAFAFGYVVAISEVLIGVAILIGFVYRIAALAGLLLNFIFFLSATWNAFPFYFGSDIVFVMCWLTLFLTGPQPGLSIDGVLSNRFSSLQWLSVSKPVQPAVMKPTNLETVKVQGEIALPENTKLYPKQISEINKAFERIKLQFVAHEETQTILEFVRAFVLSLGVERKDAAKLLEGINNIITRNSADS